jgi:hypothetical protein
VRHATRRDSNHDPIKAVFEYMLGGCVTDCSTSGNGEGDLFASYGLYGAFVEIKRDDKATLTPDQVKFHRLHSGCVFRVETIEQAENAARVIRARGMMLADQIPRKLAAGN